MYHLPNQPRAKEPGERVGVKDTIGKLKYVSRSTWRNTVTGKDAERLVVLCDPDLGGCGQQLHWSHQEFARRRRRWRAKGLTPQCRLCEDREKRPNQHSPLWKRNADMASLDKLRRLWKAIVHDRTRMDRTMKGSRKLVAYLYGSGFCDQLQFHIDRRWTSSFPGNPDPFETFLFDMGTPPEGSGYLLRKDPFGPMCRANCYWGTAGDRRGNRSDNLTAMRELGTRMVVMPDLYGDGVNVTMPYAVVQGSRYDPRLAKAGEPMAKFA